MTLHMSKDGRLFGRIEVLLTRMVGDASDTEIGLQSPWGGIIVDGYGGKAVTEKPQAWWEAEGFTVTAPPLLEEARRRSASHG